MALPEAKGFASAVETYLARGGGVRGNPKSRKAGARFTQGPIKGLTVEQATERAKALWENAAPEVRDKYVKRGERLMTDDEKSGYAEQQAQPGRKQWGDQWLAEWDASKRRTGEGLPAGKIFAPGPNGGMRVVDKPVNPKARPGVGYGTPIKNQIGTPEQKAAANAFVEQASGATAFSMGGQSVPNNWGAGRVVSTDNPAGAAGNVMAPTIKQAAQTPAPAPAAPATKPVAKPSGMPVASMLSTDDRMRQEKTGEALGARPAGDGWTLVGKRDGRDVWRAGGYNYGGGVTQAGLNESAARQTAMNAEVARAPRAIPVDEKAVVAESAKSARDAQTARLVEKQKRAAMKESKMRADMAAGRPVSIKQMWGIS